MCLLSKIKHKSLWNFKCFFFWVSKFCFRSKNFSKKRRKKRKIEQNDAKSMVICQKFCGCWTLSKQKRRCDFFNNDFLVLFDSSSNLEQSYLV